MTREKLVEIEGLRLHFKTYNGEVQALRGVDLAIHRGETVGLVGESGCGKSQTALSLLRLTPTPPGHYPAGKVRYHRPDKERRRSWVDLLRLEEAEMRKIRGNDISMIFQEPMTSLNPVMRVGDQVTEVIVNHQLKGGRAPAPSRNTWIAAGAGLLLLVAALALAWWAVDGVPGRGQLRYGVGDTFSLDVMRAPDRFEPAPALAFALIAGLLGVFLALGQLRVGAPAALGLSGGLVLLGALGWAAERASEGTFFGSFGSLSWAPYVGWYLALLAGAALVVAAALPWSEPTRARLARAQGAEASDLPPIRAYDRWMLRRGLTTRRYRRAMEAATPRAVAMLRSIGIADPERMMERYPHELSGGMRQRIMIAIALSCDPDLLVADEPTTALDVTIQAQIMDLMRDLQRRTGASVLLITHHLGVVAEMADRIAVMYAGKVVEDGPSKAVFRSPKHPYTLGLLDSIPHVHRDSKQDLPVIPGTVPNMLDPPAGCAYHPRCPFAFDRCRAKVPELQKVDEQLVACHLWDADVETPRALKEKDASVYRLPPKTDATALRNPTVTVSEAGGEEARA